MLACHKTTVHYVSQIKQISEILNNSQKFVHFLKKSTEVFSLYSYQLISLKNIM